MHQPRGPRPSNAAARRRLALALTLAACAGQASALTQRETSALPAAKLAQRALGDAGKLVAEMDPPVMPQAATPAGSNFDGKLVFYETPRPVYFQFMSPPHFMGCRAGRITVSYAGGVADSISRQVLYSTLGPQCASARTSDSYFPAPNDEAAFDIARYYDQIANAMAGPGQPPFAITCAGSDTTCPQSVRFFQHVRLHDFTDARDCRSEEDFRQRTDCYELSIDGLHFVTIHGVMTPHYNMVVQSVNDVIRIPPH